MAGVGWAIWAVGLVAGAFAIGWGGTKALIGRAGSLDLLDHPTARSLHRTPTPRGGGVAIAIAIVGAAGALLLSGTGDVGELGPLAAAAGMVAWSGWREDRTGLPIPLRLLIQLSAAGLLLWWVTEVARIAPGGNPVPGGVVTAAAILLGMVWITNLYNFMDGIDGLAAGQAVLCGAVWGTWFLAWGAHGVALLSWCVAAASAGFLLWNRFPAKIFMGDCGSLTLGFTLGGLALLGVIVYGMPWAAFALSMGVFLGDATWTLLRRMGRGEAWWLPHHAHFYQRAVRAGLPPPQVTAAGLGAGALLTAFATLDLAGIGGTWVWVGAGGSLLLALAFGVRSLEERPSAAHRVGKR